MTGTHASHTAAALPKCETTFSHVRAASRISSGVTAAGSFVPKNRLRAASTGGSPVSTYRPLTRYSNIALLSGQCSRVFPVARRRNLPTFADPPTILSTSANVDRSVPLYFSSA